ncbi:MAG: YitT family protein [Bacteroidia bacterium]|nr:YitT family protein [Bacteroidia bacterium]NND26859.1 YitT family protein [Flavobacteriaceae bacterium]MBT8277988.1 YitT family protein [Bacteroidia bacterium]NNK61243.1 YitT family protein [Flavobacteriaceae bacterium]NNL31724.1 YitT family protein [Flavobacteriaceae bacterium]
MKASINALIKILARKRLEKRKLAEKDSDTLLEPTASNIRVELKNGIREWFLIIIGVFSAGFGLKGFLLPNQFIDGGATGISLLIENISSISLSYLLILVNLPFLILASRTFSFKFAVKSMIAITFLALVVHIIPYPTITQDKLLIAVFGGFFLGLGIGMAMRGGCVIDGTEVLAIYLSRKLSLTIGDILLLINIIIFSFGAYVLSLEVALYAILTYLAAAKTVDFVVDGVEEYIGVTIISNEHEELREMIVNKLRRGCTIYAGKGGYGEAGDSYDRDIIYTVVTRLELAKLHTEIEKIDKNAFIIMGIVKDLKGGMIKRKPLK